MGQKVILSILILIALISPANAQIILPEFKEVYALGDSVESSFRIIESAEVTGLAKLSLSCSDKDIIFFTYPVSVKANELKSIAVPPYPLSFAGNCSIEAILEQNSIIDSAESKDFVISDKIDVSATFNKQTFRPEEIIKIKGTAAKANGAAVNGIATIRIGNDGYISPVTKGVIEFESTIKKTASSGEQSVSIEVKDGDNNKGEAEYNISVTPIPTTLEIFSNNNLFRPDEELEVYAVLYDQSGKEMEKVISLVLYDSWGVETAKKLSNGSAPINYLFDRKSNTGEWWVYAYSEGLKARKFISVKEVSKIDGNITENKLKISNLGNTAFKKPLEIIIQQGNFTKTEIKELNLGINSEKEFEFIAPDGSYNVTIRSENVEKRFDGVAITGGAVNIDGWVIIADLDAPVSKATRNLVAIVVSLAILALAIALRFKSRASAPIKIRKAKGRK